MQGPSTFNNIIANTVVVSGANGGVFIYSPVPGAGNLVESLGPAGTDPYGNAVIGGDVHYWSSGGTQYATQYTANQIGLWTAATQAGPWSFITEGITFLPSGITSILSNSGQDVELNNTFFVPNGGGTVRSNLPIAFAPGLGSVAETWHSMNSVGYANGWADQGAPNVLGQYRLIASPPNSIEIIGALNAAASSGAAFLTLPAGYNTFHSQQQIPAGFTGTVTAGKAPFVQCSTTGVLSASQVTLGAAGTFVFHGTLSTDA